MAANESESEKHDGQSIGHKCQVLNDKLDLLLSALHQEVPPPPPTASNSIDGADAEVSETAEQVATALRLHLLLLLLHRLLIAHDSSPV